MKATYLILNLGVLLAVIGVVRPWRQEYPRRLAAKSGAILLLLTLVFDNLIILARIEQYDPARILGLRIGVVPIEDFAYALAAVLLIPYLWERWRKP